MARKLQQAEALSPTSSCENCRRQIHRRLLPKKQLAASSYPTNTNSSTVFIQLDSLWQARAPLAAIPLRSTSTDQPSGHPKENKMASRHQRLVLSLPFCQSNETGKPETSNCFRHEKSVTWAERCRNTVLWMPTPHPPGLLELVASSKPETPHLICPTEISNGSPVAHLRRDTTQAHRKIDPGESPLLNWLEGLSKPRPSHQNHTEHSPTWQRFTNPPREIDEQPPQTESRQRPSSSPDLTTPASWSYRIRIQRGTTSPQVGPPTLPRERWRTARWSHVDTGHSLLMRQQLRASSPQATVTQSNKTQNMLRNSKYACWWSYLPVQQLDDFSKLKSPHSVTRKTAATTPSTAFHQRRAFRPRSDDDATFSVDQSQLDNPGEPRPSPCNLTQEMAAFARLPRTPERALLSSAKNHQVTTSSRGIDSTTPANRSHLPATSLRRMSSQSGLRDLQAEHTWLWCNNKRPSRAHLWATQWTQQSCKHLIALGTLRSKHRQMNSKSPVFTWRIDTSSAGYGLTAPASWNSLPTADLGSCRRPEPHRKPEGDLLDLDWQHVELTGDHSTWFLQRTAVTASTSHSEVPDEEQRLGELVSDGNQDFPWSHNATTPTNQRCIAIFPWKNQVLHTDKTGLHNKNRLLPVSDEHVVLVLHHAV